MSNSSFQVVEKTRFLDSGGRYITQSLFLEIGYTASSIYTLKDQDHTYKGVVYPSLKRLYLEMEDPTEYEFANKYLANWTHWKKLNGNKMLLEHFEEWREELDLKLRAQAIRDMMALCASEGGNYSAAKFLADRGWEKRGAGRPSKDEKERRQRVDERLSDDFNHDIARLNLVKG